MSDFGFCERPQMKPAEYVEDLQRSEDETERLINPGDLLDGGQDYTQDKIQALQEGDMVVIVDGEPNVGSADFLLEPTAELDTFKPLSQVPLESDSTLEQQTPSHHSFISSSTGEDSSHDDSQYGPFVHNVGDSE